MVSSRKVQSFTNRSSLKRPSSTKSIPKPPLASKAGRRRARSRHSPASSATSAGASVSAPSTSTAGVAGTATATTNATTAGARVASGLKEVDASAHKADAAPSTPPSKNSLLDFFGVDFGSFGQELFDWLWPNGDPCQQKEKEALNSMTMYNRFLESRLISNNEKENHSDHYNKFIHRYLLHNYADESFINIFKRLAFHMRLSPRLLFREFGAVTGKFGINILDPNEDEREDKHTREDVLALRRIKFTAYTLLGAKLLRYTMLFLLRYTRLGIPSEIKLRVLSDVLKRAHMAAAASMSCNHADFPGAAGNPLNQTYPYRNSFEAMGYPYSDEPFYTDVDSNKGWSPSHLVDPQVFRRLNRKGRAKLVCVAAALHPEYALQIVKNVAFAAGYGSERALLTDFSLNLKFTSRGARSFVEKLREELEADQKLREAAMIFKRAHAKPDSLRQALETLLNAPFVAGLVKRHLESGRRVMPLRRARMILKRVRAESELLPEHMSLWDLLKRLISRRVLNTPPRIYRQVAKQVLSLGNYLSPQLRAEIERRGLDASRLYANTNLVDKNPQSLTPNANTSTTADNEHPEHPFSKHLESLSREQRIELAKLVRRNVRSLWLEGPGPPFEERGLFLLDALAACAGYGGLERVLTLVSVLSRPPESRMARRSRQPGPEFEHSPRLEFRDFRGVSSP